MALLSLSMGRLYWKLFGAFVLATTFSFVVAFILVRLVSPPDLYPDLAVRVAAQIQEQGPDGVQALIDREGTSELVQLTDDQGRWLAGPRSISGDAPQMKVEDPAGKSYQLRVRTPSSFELPRIIPILAGFLVSLVVSAGVAWYLARPLTYLNRGFRDLAAGRLETRLVPLMGQRRDEIADLTREFDGMARKLQELVTSQERLFHDVSHELRSPLARLQVAIGLLEQEPQELPLMLPRVRKEAQQLDILIGELLTLARAKSDAVEHPIERFDVVALLNEIIDDASFEAAARNCEIEVELPANFVMSGNRILLARGLENVIRNAIKYSPEGERIRIDCEENSQRLLIVVSDRGPGVPPEMHEAILEPFKRAESGRRSNAGFGLGLAIAKHAIVKHDGTISLREAIGVGGLRVEIVLPRKVEDAD